MQQSSGLMPSNKSATVYDYSINAASGFQGLGFHCFIITKEQYAELSLFFISKSFLFGKRNSFANCFYRVWAKKGSLKTIINVKIRKKEYISVICIGNGLLLLTIITEKSLRSRKEMCIVAGLAVADLIVGSSALTVGIYRIIVLSTESQWTMTAWDCVKFPPTVFVNIGWQLTTVMNLIVSIDRYLAVAKPVLYRRLSERYTQLMLGSAGIYGIASTAALLLSTYFDKEQIAVYTRMCTGWVYPIWYGIFQFSIAAVLRCVSVGIYGAIFVAYRATRKKSSVNRRDNQQDSQQRRLTVTLGIISIFTLIFYVAPTTYMFSKAFSDVSTSQPYLMALFTRISTIATASIYIYRQKEIRTGMWKLLTCNICTSPARYTM